MCKTRLIGPRTKLWHNILSILLLFEWQREKLLVDGAKPKAESWWKQGNWRGDARFLPQQRLFRLRLIKCSTEAGKEDSMRGPYWFWEAFNFFAESDFVYCSAKTLMMRLFTIRHSSQGCLDDCPSKDRAGRKMLILGTRWTGSTQKTYKKRREIGQAGSRTANVTWWIPSQKLYQLRCFRIPC